MNQSSHIYNDVACRLLVCESCFCTATIFNLTKKLDENNQHRTAINSCPICSSNNISIISISTNDDNNSNTNILLYHKWSKRKSTKLDSKSSCRACGASMNPTAICSICKEHVCWTCSRCHRTEDATHVHRPLAVQRRKGTERI